MLRDLSKQPLKRRANDKLERKDVVAGCCGSGAALRKKKKSRLSVLLVPMTLFEPNQVIHPSHTPSTLDIIKLNPTYTLIHTVTEKGRKGHKERGEVYKTTTKICQINMRRYKLTLCNGQQRERRIMSVRSHISFFSHMYILNHDTKENQRLTFTIKKSEEKCTNKETIPSNNYC